MKILVLNSGSSSLKYQVIDMDTEEVLAKGNFERIGQDNSFLTHKKNGEKYRFEVPVKDHEAALKIVFEKLTDPEIGVLKDLSDLGGIGHRIVHGGEKYFEPCLVTDEVENGIEECSEFAPLHNPAAVLGIRACKKLAPGIPMVTVFDTGFHQTIPEERYIYPIPFEYYEKYKIRKYGAHGTSHKYVANRVAKLMGKDIKDLKIVSCHLGQGASLCAVKDGKSVETSMGLTPLGGIPMGSRSGDLDPSVVLYLMRKENITPDEMDNILNKKSGVLGVSGISADFRDIEAAAAKGDKRAILALANYNYLVACYVMRCAVAMGGMDVIVFTAGVGENGPETRKAVCKNLEFMGVKIDEKLNDVKGDERKISTPDSKVAVYIVPTNEELEIARETLKIVEKL